MSEMVERVARAISDPAIWDENLFKIYGDLWMAGAREKAMKSARAAIAAMREPTKDMSIATNRADSILEAWQMAIDEALK